MEFKTITLNINKLRIRPMGDVSENFSRSEFACKCGCGFAAVDVELLSVLELVRKKFRRLVKVNSACRCEKHNKLVSWTKSSKHTQGIAADIVVSGVKPYDVYLFLDGYMPNKYGIGLYKTFTHIDVRKDKWRDKG